MGPVSYLEINDCVCAFQRDTVTNICQAADKQLFTLVDWAKRIPHFSELSLDDQVILLRAGKLCFESYNKAMMAWLITAFIITHLH